MNRKKQLAIVMMGGALIFWLPSVFIHLLTGKEFAGWCVIFLTLFIPIVSTIALIKLIKMYALSIKPWIISLCFLGGIWILGPEFTAISAIFGSTDPFDNNRLDSLFFMLLSFPISTFIASTYDGTLGALIIVSLGLSAIIIIQVIKSKWA